VNSVLNIKTNNDEAVPYLKHFKNEPLFGQAGIKGFNNNHSRLFQSEYPIFNHSAMMKPDFFEKILIPHLNLMSSFNYGSNPQYYKIDDLFGALQRNNQ
jgi:hypothetical protein